MPLEKAIQTAVVDCIDKNVLKKFLLKHKEEVINMMVSEWNMDTALEVKFEEGMEEKAEKIAKKLLAEGKDVDYIANLTDLTVDEVLKLSK